MKLNGSKFELVERTSLLKHKLPGFRWRGQQAAWLLEKGMRVLRLGPRTHRFSGGWETFGHRSWPSLRPCICGTEWWDHIFFRPLLTLKMPISFIYPIRAQGSPVKMPCATCILLHSPYGGKDRNRRAGPRGDRAAEAGAGRGLPSIRSQRLRMLTGRCVPRYERTALRDPLKPLLIPEASQLTLTGFST